MGRNDPDSKEASLCAHAHSPSTIFSQINELDNDKQQNKLYLEKNVDSTSFTMDDNKAVPSTSAHGDATPSQRIKVDKSCFQDIYDTLEFCKIDFVTLEEGIFNESISFTDNRVTHRHSVEQCDVVEVLMKKIKKKSSPRKSLLLNREHRVS